MKQLPLTVGIHASNSRGLLFDSKVARVNCGHKEEICVTCASFTLTLDTTCPSIKKKKKKKKCGDIFLPANLTAHHIS